MLEVSANQLYPVAEYFKVLSEVSRLQVLCALRSGQKNVTEIMEITGLRHANISKHLQILAQVGIVSRHPQGVSVYYQIIDPAIFDICDIVCKSLETRLQRQTENLQGLEFKT
jgi:DNA-binding transcriptional ArsR family regulator